MTDAETYRDELPKDLDITQLSNRYQFPDIARRRITAIMLTVLGLVCLGLWFWRASGGVLVNGGMLFGGIAFSLIALYHFSSAWRLEVSETDALTKASQQVGFPVGHASAQLGWAGLRSRPIWKILLYSSENPPLQRGLVVVDAVNGKILLDLVERNPEDWSVTRDPV